MPVNANGLILACPRREEKSKSEAVNFYNFEFILISIFSYPCLSNTISNTADDRYNVHACDVGSNLLKTSVHTDTRDLGGIWDAYGFV